MASEMVNALVLYAADPPPVPACRTVKLVIDAVAPRSTRRYLALAVEHHLSLLPPETLPLTAFSGPSVAAHGADPVAGQCEEERGHRHSDRHVHLGDAGERRHAP